MNPRRQLSRDTSWFSDTIAMDYSSDVEASYSVDRSSDLSSDLSSESLDYEDTKVALQSIIDEMVTDAPTWDGESATISSESAETAIRFLKGLPSNRFLPKVAPDGEGDVLLVWEPPNGSCIVTVQSCLLHLVDSPGTAQAGHVDSQAFNGNRIPPSILHAIPMK